MAYPQRAGQAPGNPPESDHRTNCSHFRFASQSTSHLLMVTCSAGVTLVQSCCLAQAAYGHRPSVELLA